jgi:hypothetical protein
MIHEDHNYEALLICEEEEVKMEKIRTIEEKKNSKK